MPRDGTGTGYVDTELVNDIATARAELACESIENAWNQWVVSTSTCSTCSSIHTDNVYHQWVTCTSSSSTTINIWNAWTGQAISNAKAAAANMRRQRVAPVETTEQRMAREAADVKRRAEAAERERVEAQKRLKAKTRAKKLLMDHITKEQRESLEKHGFFEVLVGGKTYRIRQGTHGNVRLIENGKETKSFCIQPNDIPDEDAMLAQKLLLETDEAAFLRIANARVLVAN